LLAIVLSVKYNTYITRKLFATLYSNILLQLTYREHYKAQIDQHFECDTATCIRRQQTTHYSLRKFTVKTVFELASIGKNYRGQRIIVNTWDVSTQGYVRHIASDCIGQFQRPYPYHLYSDVFLETKVLSRGVSRKKIKYRSWS